ncbi:MAG: hypothetical protein WD048_09370 [Chitinophagales bacterium]
MTETYNFSSAAKKTAYLLIGLGTVGTILGGILSGDSARVWANLLINSYYGIGIGLAALFLLAAHTVGYAGWHIMVKRILEAVGSFIPIAGIGLLIVLIGTVFHFHHIYHWTDAFIKKEKVTVAEVKSYQAELATHGSEHAEEEHGHGHKSEGDAFGLGKKFENVPLTSMEKQMIADGHHVEVDLSGLSDDALIENPYYDPIIDGKKAFLNVPFYSFRIILYLFLWSMFYYLLRRVSLKEDEIGGIQPYKKSKMYSALFLVVFAVTSSTGAWDIVMSIDTHWYSTLFGWYNMSSYFVAGVAVVALIAMYLKANGYLEKMNDEHFHDLGKYLFGFSVFWTYLWFSQFLLIWYGNIPEATMYYAARFDSLYFKIIFFFLPVINFVFPLLVLMTKNAKRNKESLGFVAVVLILGHWLDFYLMVMPGGVGETASLGLLELSMLTLFVGLFIFTVLNTLTKASLVPSNNPYLKESIHYHS